MLLFACPLVYLCPSWYCPSGMYCEIVVKHRDVITGPGLKAAIGGGRLGTDIVLATAYGMSAIYKLAPPAHSLFAFDTPWNCFVIARGVNYRTSTYHIEGNSLAVSVETLFQAAQEYSENLLRALRTSPTKRGYMGRSLAGRLFEVNGRETGVEGKLVTLASTFRKKSQWTELRSSLIAFLTAMALIHYGLKQESPTAALASFIITLVFTLSDTFFAYYRGRGRIEWELRQV